MGAAGAAVDGEPQPLRHLDDLGAEPRLADPRLAGQADDLPLAGERALGERPHPGALPAPAHQRLGGRARGRPVPRPVAHGADRPDLDSSGPALDRDRLEMVLDGGLAHPLVGRLVDEELSRPGGLHEAGGEVHRIADHRVLAPGVRADLATVDRAGGDSGLERPPGLPEQLQAAVHGALLVVLVADGRAEEGDQQAALVAGGHLAKVAAIAVDHPHGRGQVALHGGHRSGVVRGELRQPDEGDGDLAVLVHEIAPAGPQPLGDGRVEEGGQPARPTIVQVPQRRWPRWLHLPDPPAQAADNAPPAPTLQHLGAQTVIEHAAVHDDLAAAGVLLGRGRAVEGRPREHALEPDRRVPHDGEQQRAGGQTGLHRQPEGPGPGGDGAEAGHRGLHVERALDRPSRGRPAGPAGPAVVAEHGGQRIPGELHHAAAIARDAVGHGAEPAVQDPGQLLGAVAAGSRQRLAHGGEAHDVGEQHDRIRALAIGDRGFAWVPEQRADHVFGHEGAPRRTQARVLETEAVIRGRQVLAHGSFSLCPTHRSFRLCGPVNASRVASPRTGGIHDYAARQ